MEEDLPREFGEGGPRKRPPVPTSPDLVADSVVAKPLAERMRRAGRGEHIGIVVELRSAHPEGVRGAAEDVMGLLREVSRDAPVRRGRSYVSTSLTTQQIRDLMEADRHRAVVEAAARREDRGLVAAHPGEGEAGLVGAHAELIARTPTEPGKSAPRWAVHRLWPNFEVHGLIHRSGIVTKCDAGRRAFGASGAGIVWAVLDSGIEAGHPHFATYANLRLSGVLAHKSFLPGTTDNDALKDEAGHGTHVAGILAGAQVASAGRPVVAATWYQDDEGERHGTRLELNEISGMAPRCTLVSCKVLRDDESGDISAVLEALEYVQDLNRGGRELNVHGVNLSVGHSFDPSWFGTGLTPVCREVDRLVRSGVVVVVSAGNTGYGYALDDAQDQMRLGFDMTINDPGNAEKAITVGSTSSSPHLTGISYFSSKGPTGDGRMKPDLVAPGERIVSAAAGRLLREAQKREPEATYAENSGTSMSAPHVSGVAAAFLSVHQEFVGRPEDVKRILLESAVDLGRSRGFQGRGLVDALRAMQAV
jgi:serine protease AprX